MCKQEYFVTSPFFSLPRAKLLCQQALASKICVGAESARLESGEQEQHPKEEPGRSDTTSQNNAIRIAKPLMPRSLRGAHNSAPHPTLVGPMPAGTWQGKFSGKTSTSDVGGAQVKGENKKKRIPATEEDKETKGKNGIPPVRTEDYHRRYDSVFLAGCEVSFEKEDFVAEPHGEHGYDVVCLFSVVKWMHLNGGDDAVRAVFRKVHALLRPGGRLLLEPQVYTVFMPATKRCSCLDLP